LALVWFSI